MSQSSRKSGFILALFLCFYVAAMLACLRQRGTAHPWSRLDVFSGGYIAISLCWIAASLRFMSFFLGPKDVASELSGAAFDPVLLKAISVLSVGELSVFIDYGHLHLLPVLERALLQGLGLALSLAGCVWLIWTDRYLLSHFAKGLTERSLLTTGPYQLVRHPRYAALAVSRLAFALALASPLAWGFFALWMIFILRRIRLEEVHLKGIFGNTYDAYAARTARLIPGLY